MSANVTGGLVAVVLATTEIVSPELDSWAERLGTAGILVVAGVFLVRWLMGELAKKDDYIKEVTAAATVAAERNTATLLLEMRSANEVKGRVADALTQLTIAIREKQP